MAEKRHSKKRITRIFLSKISMGDETLIGYIQDLGLSGIGVTCNTPISVKTEMKLAVNLPNRVPMTISGAVVWRRRLPEVSRHKFLYGVRITQDVPKEYAEFIDEEYDRAMERRQETRMRFFLSIAGKDVLKLIDASTEDVSAKGLYIRTKELLEVGADYTLTLEGEQMESPIVCMGRVVSCFECDADNFEHSYGAGIKIISFQEGDEKRFRIFLEGLADLYRYHWPVKDHTESHIKLSS